MSYNIDAFKIRSLSLELPEGFDFQQWVASQPEYDVRGHKNTGKQWCLKGGEEIQINLAAQTWELSFMGEEAGLYGILEDRKLLVKGLNCRGEASGYLYRDIVLPLFKEYEGNLEVIVVWERGDTIEHVTISEGNVSSKEIQ